MTEVANRPLRRNLFEIENARSLTVDEVVKTFVPTQSFWRMLSAKHHVLLGSRGSGKTAIAKMLSHDHLARWDDERAGAAVASRAFIGIYLPTRLEWVRSIQNPIWKNDDEKRAYFCWRVNIATALAFLNTIRSCLDTYLPDKGTRARSEEDLCDSLSRIWFPEERIDRTIELLREKLELVAYQRQQQLALMRSTGATPTPVGLSFDVDLFAPLQMGMSQAKRVFELPEETAWLLCIDEAEHLDDDHQRIINSYMRAYTGSLFFKIATMPYSHLASETITSVALDPGHDYEYVYLDNDPTVRAQMSFEKGRIGTQFARQLFSKRVEAGVSKYRSATLEELLGSSQLLDPEEEDWSEGSQNRKLLEKYASRETLARAQKLYGTEKFSSEIGRKVHSALLLHAAVAEVERGGRRQLRAYSGATMAMRCSDSNPRRLIRIFNAMLLGAKWKEERGTQVPERLARETQTRILRRIARQILRSAYSEPKCGPRLFEMLNMIGEFMRHSLHERPLSTDQVSSILIKGAIGDQDWAVVQRAVQKGYLYPNMHLDSPDELPEKSGTFHFAYVFAPQFYLMPRRGKARTLETIQEFWKEARSKWDPGQLRLFAETG